MTSITIRSEQPQDVEAISQLLLQAFANHPYSINNEHLIVNALRKANALTLSLVAEQAGEVIGYLALSPLFINQRPSHWLGLGPLAVTPPKQQQSIGSQLMQQAIKYLQQHTIDGCVLVGDPNYYHRFGFKQAAPLTYPDLDPQFLMAYSQLTDIPTGQVTFHPAFYTTT